MWLLLRLILRASARRWMRSTSRATPSWTNHHHKHWQHRGSGTRDADDDFDQDFQYAAARHVSVIDASGDFGASSRQTLIGPQGPGCCFTYQMRGYPASDPLVTTVGATRLHLDARGNRISPDTVANDPGVGASGGGLSTIFPRPDYQDAVESVVGDYRGGPDVSMSGDLYGGFEIYSSFPNQTHGPPTEGWTGVGGTSESAPLFAGIAAIAVQAAGRALGPFNPYLYAAYQLPSHGGLVPVTRGTTRSRSSPPAGHLSQSRGIKPPPDTTLQQV